MCTTCGCSDQMNVTITNMRSGKHFHLDSGVHEDHEHSHADDHAHEHDHQHHEHSHDVPHHHDHDHGGAHHRHDQDQNHSHRNDASSRTIQVQHELLARNNQLAERNRGWFAGRNILALNLMSAPGAGKTTLLESTIRDLQSELSFSVIEGDQATTNDAKRIQATGCPVMQVNTGAGCHLDSAMIQAAVRKLDPPMDSVLVIENVGNLVCPALFDLGESARVVIVSVAEGDDKPAKYPHMFRSADAVILNKIDLLPHVNFKLELFTQLLRQVNSSAVLFQLSATRRDGISSWYDWLRSKRLTMAHEF